MKRFEVWLVWLVQLNPTQGKEINKTRPCVIISPDETSALSTRLVAPMTTKGFEIPCRVPCHFQAKDGLIILDQIRAVDKSRFTKKLGSINQKTQKELCAKLQELFQF